MARRFAPSQPRGFLVEVEIKMPCVKLHESRLELQKIVQVEELRLDAATRRIDGLENP